METVEVWEGTERGRTVQRLIRAGAIVENDREANAREFFRLDVENLKHIGDVEIHATEGESSDEVLGYCWVQQEYTCKRDLSEQSRNGLTVNAT